MERLQIAIEKARLSRRQAQVAARPEDLPAAADAAAEAPAGTPATGADAAWDQLRPMELNHEVLQHNRVITFDSDPRALAFDQLRTRIVQQSRQQGWRRIAVVSPHSAAGKTTLVANLAFCLGRQDDLRSIVLDFDMRRPGLAKMLGLSLPHTMGEVISGRVPFAEHGLRYGDNLAFGLNGRSSKKTSELLQSQRAFDMLAELEETYRPDLVLFDMPPILAADDAPGFLRQVDAALIVIEAERTPISQVDTVEAQVAELTQVFGLVLNRCNYPETGSGRYGDYGYY